MNSTFFKRLFGYSIFSLTIFLLFLIIFEHFLEFPQIVSWIGHFHPLILHFPIVLVLVTIIQYWRNDVNLEWYVTSTTILTLLSAITGFILSSEGGTKGNLLLIHQWMGVSVALIMVFWYYQQNTSSKKILKLIQGVLVILIVSTGHYGGMVTHGKDFLSFSSDSNSSIVSLPDDPNIYTHVVQPIFDKKCVSCHNENKAKGELMLTDFSSFMDGGESGSLIDSEIGLLHRIELPQNHDDHMPPADEEQLEEDEIEILKEWLGQGGTNQLMFSELNEGSALNQLVGQIIKEGKSNAWQDLPEIDNEVVEELNSEYCTIKRMYHESNALQVLVFPHSNFSTKDVQNLKPISKNIVELNLSNLPLSEKELKIIGDFENVEFLDLSGTSISNESITSLEKLEKLKTLKIYNTALDDKSIRKLASAENLSKLYVYETNISESGIEELKSESLNVIDFAEEALDFKSILPSPLLEPLNHFFNEPFYLKIEHPLDGINIKYTLDGSTPGSNSENAADSLFINKNYTLKFYASKEGWESSPLDSIQFLNSKIKPAQFELLNPADQKYLGVGKSLLFDLEKGSGNFGDDAWMAFKNNSFVLNCEFEEQVALSGVVLSSLVNTDPHIFPPSKIKIFGGNSPQDLRILKQLNPPGLRERSELHFQYYNCSFDPISVKHIRIEVEPLRKIPIWHQGKAERGWFFIDEVVLLAED